MPSLDSSPAPTQPGKRGSPLASSLPMAFVPPPPSCCFGTRAGVGVPTDARSAVRRMRGATQAALAVGKRGLLVDVLVESMRRDARTFDAAVQATLIEGLVRAIAPAMIGGDDASPSVRLVVPGTRAALHLTEYFGSVVAREEAREKKKNKSMDGRLLDSGPASLPPVEIDMLGTGDFLETNGALVVVEPPGVSTGVIELDRVVHSAMKRNCPVVILNHPQEGSVHKITGYPGQLPSRMAAFEPVFMLAPFAIHAKPEKTDPSQRILAGRFVLLRVFPAGWELWRQQGAGGFASSSKSSAELTELESRERRRGKPEPKTKVYTLCEQWDDRPSERELFEAVTLATKRYSRHSL